MEHWSIPNSQSSEAIAHGHSRSYPGSPSLTRRRSCPISAGSPDDYHYTTLTKHGDVTPPLPPRSRSTPTPPPRRKASLPYSTPVLLEDKGPFSLRTFVSKYGHVLPLRVSVEKGHHSGDERRSIAMGDMYNVHFVKHCQVAALKDSNGTTYNIPLSSSLQFAPIFSDSEPNSETEKRFETVADVIKHKPLPRILRALHTHSSDDQSSVERNEILLVQEVVQSPKKGKKALKVYSDTKMEEKILPSNCVGHFTADSYATRLHLPTIVLHFRAELPLTVQVYITDIDASESGDFPFHLASEESEITEILTETSLVVTTHFQKGQSGDDTTQIEIPIDLPIEVSILQPDPTKEREADLLHRTRTIFEAFDPSRLHSICTSSSELSTALRKGYEREGVELQRPSRVYDVPSRRTQSPVLPKRDLSPVNKQDPPPMLPQRDPPPMLPERDPPPPLPKRSTTPLPPRCEVLPMLHKRTPPPAVPKRDVPIIRHTPAPVPAKYTYYEISHSSSHEQPPPHFALGTQSLDRRKRDRALYMELNGDHTYQSLLIPPPTASPGDDLYATISSDTRSAPPSRTGTRSQQAMLASQNIASTANVGDLQFAMESEDASTLIRQLISRIESLEHQVASLTYKVEKLQK